MKKTLLASAITLTFLGFATNPALAEEKHLQTTTAETTQETTSANKVENNKPSTKETAPSTETSSSLPTTSTTTPSTSSNKKEETKAPEVKKMGGYLKKISGASMKQTNLFSIGKKFTANGTISIKMESCLIILFSMVTF